MRPILLQIPAIPIAAWIGLLAAFFAFSAYLGARDIAADDTPADERRKRTLNAVMGNLGLFLLLSAVLFHFRAQVHHPLPVRSYGFMLMLAFLAGMMVLIRNGRGTRLSPESAVDFTLGLLLSSVVCARVLFILLNWGSYSGHLADLFRVWEGGLSFHGGLIGGIIWVAWYTWRHELGFLWLGDLLVPAGALGYAIARIGCFLNGCCYGTPTNLPWAVRFQDPPLSGHWTPPSHPVQIYASILNIGIFAALMWFLRRKRYDGQIVGLYLIFYSGYRFAAEALRKGVTAQVFALGMTQAQWASIGIAGLGALLMWYLRQRATAPAAGSKRKADEPTPTPGPTPASSRAAAPKKNARAGGARKASGQPGLPPRGKARRSR